MTTAGADPLRIGHELDGAVVTVDPALPERVHEGVERIVGRPVGTGRGPRVHIGPHFPELAEGERLLWVHSSNAGVDALLKARTPWPREVLLTRTVGRMGERIGQYVLAWVLAELQNVPGFLEQHARRTWHRLPTELADGALAVVLGAGRIGTAIGTALQQCGVHTVGVARSPREMPGFDSVVPLGVPEEPGGGPAQELADVLAKARWVVNALPLTPQTRGLVGAGLLGALRGATFINVGRGETVLTDALARALDDGTVGHAVLDVLPEEPAAPADPAWDLPRTTLTCHSAGPTTHEDVTADFRAAWQALRAGELPTLTVRVSAGY
ncbi:D-2-hydroxyacid dehydrogenase [Streptomyces tubbatahanensis]|uniref:D-2-hydroxyacid dehydrogenase n=1 Tax=Streptomyces tubbatahanensis TaxID=2923272 RepID=A0ABY3Y0K0_9ACTN|nr:NAD(P)-dependent oxidoreductase [Streptomyces tubbatahanensis]UNT00151.1 D-2-hydroxyacid dehydrogenase [Streptomyces tubbatahanensis]